MFRTSLHVLLALLAPAALVSSAQAQGLRWRSGGVLERPAPFARPAPAELVSRMRAGDARHVLVRFERSPSAHERAFLRAAGIELGHALGSGTFFARVDPAALDAQAAARVGGLVDVRELALDWKLHPTLLAGETPPWTVVAVDAAGAQTVAVYVLLQAGESLEAGAALLQRLGGSTFDVLESVNGMVALVPRAAVNALAAADGVAWVEPALPPMDSVALRVALPVNDSNRALTQANALQAAPYGLDGTGVNVLVYDGGTARSTHDDFSGRLAVRDASGMIDHATHVAATIGGDGGASGGTFRGMAPAATIQSYGFQWDGSGNFFFTNPGDFEDDYDEALNVFGVDVANNSIGSNVEPNGYHCPIQGDYGVICTLIDGVVRGSLGAPLRVVWANGNERQGSRCDLEGFGDYYSTAPPATAKNHITVGALNSNDDSMASFSSWGPTDDGRLKPDISAPGCEVGGDGGVTSALAGSDTAYGSFCGTSMASPTVCGISALMLEDYRIQFGLPDPLNSTLKVLLAHTAFDRGNAGPDYQFGYGSVRAQSAVDFMRLGRFLEDGLDETGAFTAWSVTVPALTGELRLTLAWDDAPAQPNVFGSLVNDLDLVVRDPLGAQHHVWTLDPSAPSAAAVRAVPDRLNNIEQVLVTSPTAGTWTVEVRAHDVPSGPQSFSLASSHALAAEPHVRISYPSALPVVLAPGLATSVTARIVGVNDTVVGGSPTLHARYGAGGFIAFPMSALGGDLYQASLPPGVCTATPEFYFSAQGAASGLRTHPAAAPAETHAAIVATVATVFTDDFQANLGWTVSNTALTDGPWERATPADGTRGAPLNAWGGSGLCFVTDNAVGNSDIDGGPTRLLSPLFDLSAAGDYVVSYARWFTNDDYDVDAMTVQVSNDGGTGWTTVENVTNGGSGGGWVRASFDVGTFLAPTNLVRVRFNATDNPNDSVTEAGLDDFRIERRSCSALPDCNSNGILDSDDIASGRSQDVDSNNVPDECSSGAKVPKKRVGPPAVAPPVTLP